MEPTLLDRVDRRAQGDGVTRSAVIRTAVEALLQAQATDGDAALGVDDTQLHDICQRYGVIRLEIFGSGARGEATTTSDVDLLYTLGPGVRLGWEIEDLAAELGAAFGRRIDLISRSAVNPRLRETVLRDARVLYAA
ncbi:MAG: nucleotidyltransferase family protein [Propioniciclava sp.]